MLLKPNQWHFAVVCVTALLAAGAQAQETTATPNNLGFQVDSIQDPSGSIDFADQFEAGVSTVEVTHKVNLLECVTYNNEETLGTVEGALGTDDRDSEDPADAETDATEEEGDTSDPSAEVDANTDADSDTGTDSDTSADADAAIVEEVNLASCFGFCGAGSADGTCFCDGSCEEFGDCCDDFCEACPDLGSCAGVVEGEGGENETETEETAEDEEEQTETEEGETDTQECTLGSNAPMAEITFSVDSSLVDFGYSWSAKVGSCGSGDLTATSESCLLLTDSAQELARTGNSFEIPLSKLIGTMDETDDTDVTERQCCSKREGYSGSTSIYVFIGSDTSGAVDVEYDIISFEYDYLAPAAPSGVEVEVLGETLSVRWDAPAGEGEDTTYRVYYATQSFETTDGIQFADSDDTSVQLDGLTTNEEYSVRVGAVDDFGNVSPLSSAATGTPIETYDGWEQYRAMGGQEEGGCFIATAAFGSYVEPHVMTLRTFRDQILMKEDWGRAFVTWYYAEGPVLAEWIRDSSILKGIVRIALMPLVWFSAGALTVGLLPMLTASLFGLVLMAWGARRTLRTAVGTNRTSGGEA